MDARVKAIIAHLTPLGWIVAVALNSTNKEEYSSFYIRQTLGLYICGIVLKFIPILGWLISILIFAFWLLSLIYAAQGYKRAVPYGSYFQEWFSAL